MLSRYVMAVVTQLLVTTSLHAADDLPKAEATPGTCFVYNVDEETGVEKDPAAAVVNRVELQPLQYKIENKPIPETRIRLGIRPRGQNGPLVTDTSAACTGEKLTFACTMKCGDKAVGKFRAEALPTKPTDPKAHFLRLIIEAPTVLNGCTEGKQPYTVPNELVNVQIILKSATPTDCSR
jgi:hypothetical protein